MRCPGKKQILISLERRGSDEDTGAEGILQLSTGFTYLERERDRERQRERETERQRVSGG